MSKIFSHGMKCIFPPISDLWVWNKIENRVSITLYCVAILLSLYNLAHPAAYLDRIAHLDEKRPSCQHVMLPFTVCTSHLGLAKSLIIDWHGKTCPKMWMEFSVCSKVLTTNCLNKLNINVVHGNPVYHYSTYTNTL